MDKYISPAFVKLLKDSSESTTPQELKDIQENLNICSNVNIKQLLMTIQEIANNFPKNKLKFNWTACFAGDTSLTHCPDILSESIRNHPDEARSLIKVLNGIHYSERNYIKTLNDILVILGRALYENFNISEVSEGKTLMPLRLERFMKDHDKILENGITNFDEVRTEDENLISDKLMKTYMKDLSFEIPLPLIPKIIIPVEPSVELNQIQTVWVNPSNDSISQQKTEIVVKSPIKDNKVKTIPVLKKSTTKLDNLLIV